MKKFLFVMVVLFLMVPFSSFKSNVAMAKPLSGRHAKTFTTWYLGWIYYDCDFYDCYGDNSGGTSGTVVAISVNSVPVYSFSGTWSTTYGPSNIALGVNVHVQPESTGDGFDYDDNVFQ